MATRGGYQQNGFRRQVGSPKTKGRENKDTLCRNITIYGHCRYENSGCTFNHEQPKGGTSSTDMSKKSFNVDSPSFTPASSSTPQPTAKKPAFSTNASVFTPRGSGTATPTGVASNVKPDGPFAPNPAAVPEFTPQGFGLPGTAAGDVASSTTANDGMNYDAYAIASLQQTLPSQFNPYSEDASALAAANTYYPQQTAYGSDPQSVQPLHHHLYFPMGPHREDLLPYQRTSHDFFTSEKLRQETTKKLEATRQVINTGLPTLDGYHSLLALDTSNRKNVALFGFPTWIYKAFETKTGFARCLRRIEGFRLSSEVTIRKVKDWKQVDCASVVPVHSAFSTRAFGDSSLIFVQEYFPLSKTLLETHFPTQQPTVHGNRHRVQPINERTLWSYVTQIGNALKAIHAEGLAARCLDLSKIIVTDKNRIRLIGCAILDVVRTEDVRTPAELQQEDLRLFGLAILSLASHIPPTQLAANYQAAGEFLTRIYSTELRDAVGWLISAPQPGEAKTIDEFIRNHSGHFVTALNDSLNSNDQLAIEYTTALENGRIARLMMKLAAINERPDLNGDAKWAENGDRYVLKLFRDYVFHQVDANGKPVVDVGHMITCLNKVDAGVDDLICLTSRDNETNFVVTYKKIKELLRNSFAELTRGSKGRGGM